MEDINALYKALEQADAAGDKDSAQELADYIRTLPTETSTTEQPVVDITQAQTVKPLAPKQTINVMGQQFTPEEYAKYSGMPIAAKEGEQAKGAFSGSFGRSIYNLAADLALAHGRATGNYDEAEATAKRLREYGAKTYTDTTKSWKEDPLAKIQELAGGSAPYMVGPIVAAMGSSALGATGAAAVAAPLLTSATQFTGSNLQRQMDQNKKLSDTSLLKAGAIAIPQAALDQIGFRFIPGVKKLFGAAGREISDQVAEQLVKRSILAKAGEKALEVGEGMTVEGATEAAQQLLERLQAGLSITNPEALNEYLDSFIGGAVLAGGIGGAHHVTQKAIDTLLPSTQTAQQKEAEVETETPAEEKRASRDTLVKATLKDLEDKANEVNRVKAEEAAKLKAAQQQQVVSEATDLESMAPVNPTALTDTTLTSWGISKNSKAYKTLIGQDASTPEGRALIDDTLDAHTGKINEQAVETYKSLLDQQKVEETNGKRIDTGTVRIDNEVPGQPKYGTPGGVEGYNGPAVNISGAPINLPETGVKDVNAPLETIEPVVPETTEVEAPATTEAIQTEEVQPKSAQTKLASQLRVLDPSNPNIEALINNQASDEEVATAQEDIKALQASRKAKKVDLTKVAEEEKDIPLEARGEIQNTGENPDTIREVFQKEYGKNVRLGEQRGLLNFLNDVSELPPEVGPVSPNTRAVYHKGKGYFITNRITKADAPRMILHEIGAHYGLEGMLGTANFKRIVKQIKQNHLTDKELKASWENTLKTYPEYPEGSNNFMQEVIANIGETAPNNTIFRQIMGYIKQFLSKLGYGWNVDKITADDIRDMVQHSVRVALRGKTEAVATETTLAETKEKPTFYSQLKKELLAHPQQTMPAEQWRMWLSKKAPKKGIKEEEIEYSKIREFLDQAQPKTRINKDELLSWVGAHLPKVEAVQLGGAHDTQTLQALKEKALKRQIGIDNFNIALNNLRQKLIDTIPDAHYKNIFTKLPDGWTVRKSEDGDGFDVLTPEGQRMASGDTEQEAISWALHDVLNLRRERELGGNSDWIGPEDGTNIDELVSYIRRDVEDETEANPEDIPDYSERMTALDIAHNYAPQELDELWGAHHDMRRSQGAFNTTIESLNDDARFTNWTLPGDREGDVNFAMVFDNNGSVIYTAPFIHSMGMAGDQNRIVHIRGNIRKDINGNRVFFVEEIQSDWGQKAYDLRQQAIDNLKKLGFSEVNAKKAIPTDYGFKQELTSDEKNRLQALNESIERTQEEIDNLDSLMDRQIEGREKLIAEYEGSHDDPAFQKRLKDTVVAASRAQLQRTALKSKIKDMIAEASALEYRDQDKVNKGPYVADTKAWVTLALKQIFRYAADQGLNKVMFVNGQQSAERYNLSQVVDTVKWSKRPDGTYNLIGSKNGYNRVNKYGIEKAEIIENFGQNVYNEIRDQEAKYDTDPLRVKLLDLKSAAVNALNKRNDIETVIYDWIINHYGVEPSEATSFLQSINDLKGEDLKLFLDEYKVPQKLSTDYIKAADRYNGLSKRYETLMKRNGLGDLSSPIAGDIDVHELELNAEGKGMKDFYDNIVPQAIRDYVKRIGGGEIIKLPILDFDTRSINSNQLQVTLSPKAMETVSGAQPLFARMSEEELDRQLAASGSKYRPKVSPPTLADRFKAHPVQTVGEIVRNFRKAGFSFDHAINQKIMEAMRKNNISQEEFAKSFYEIQVSQAVKSDQMADLFMIHGDLQYDPRAYKFIVSDVRDSMISIRNKLSNLAEKYDVSETKMFEYASAAFIARRSRGLIAANNALKKRALKLMIDGKKAQATALMKRNYKLVHLTPAEIKAGEKFFGDFKDARGNSELEKIFKSWNKNRERVLNFAQQQGLYSEDDIEDLLNVMDYVPFYRDEQIESGKGPKEYARGLLDAAADKRLKGSYQPVNNVFDNMERWTRYVLRKSINNRAAQEKIRLYSKWVPDDIKQLAIKERSKTGNIVNVWQNGKLVKYEFQGTDGKSMVDGFTGLEPVHIPLFNGFFRPFANFLRLNIVLQPVFSIAQIPMDMYNAILTSKTNYGIVALPLQVIKEIMLTPFGMSAARNYLKTTGTVGKHDFSSEYERIDIDAMHDAKKAGSLTKLIKLIAHPFGMLAMASDNVIRQAVYSQVMLETGDRARAVHMAEEIINFRRTGSSGLVNVMRQNAPFVNANLQSLHIAFSTILNDGIDPDTKAESFRRLVTTGASMFVLAMLYAVLNADDDKYKELDPSERDRYLIIPGSNGYKLPLRNDIITLLFKTLPEHLVNRFILESEDSTKMLHALKVGLTRALTLPSGLPTVATPAIEAMYNIDLNTGRPIVGRGQENLEEDLQYSNKYTSQLSRVFGDASGVSPAVIQHFFDRYFGTTTLLMGMITNGLVAATRGEILPEKSVREYLLQIPSMSSFVTKEHGARNVTDYYELNDIVTKIVASAKRYEKLDYKKYQEYLAKDNHAEIINMQKEMASISKELQVLRDYENQIYASKDVERWTPATKKAELDRIEGIRQDMLGHQLKLKDRTDRYIQQLRYRGGL